MSGDRYNVGKPRISLVPYTAVKEIAKVLTFGAEKYGPWNWAKGLSWLECCDSLERHIGAWKEGEDLDDESGIHHLAHAGCNIMFLLFFSITGKYEAHDDRMPHEILKDETGPTDSSKE
jgi:hypothetical protein